MPRSLHCDWRAISDPILIARPVASFLRRDESEKKGLYKINDNLTVLKERQTRDDADIAKAEIVQLLKTYKAA